MHPDTPLAAENARLTEERDLLRAKLGELALCVRLYEQVLSELGWAGRLDRCPVCHQFCIVNVGVILPHGPAPGERCDGSGRSHGSQ